MMKKYTILLFMLIAYCQAFAQRNLPLQRFNAQTAQTISSKVALH